MTKPWMLDEMAHAGPEHLDPGFVAGYDRKRGPGLDTEDLAFLRAHGMSASSTVLDLAAGTGRFTIAAAPQCRRVIAVDVSPAMVDSLRERAAAAGLTNVECVRAGFLSYEHAGPPVDVVYTRHALHQLPDFWKAIALHRIAGMMRPGGILRIRDLIYDFTPSEAEGVLDHWTEGATDDPSAGYTRAEYEDHIRNEYSTFRWLFEPMLLAAGFQILTASYHNRVYGAYTCRRP